MGGGPKPWHGGTTFSAECISGGQDFAVLQGDGLVVSIFGNGAAYFEKGKAYDFQAAPASSAAPVGTEPEK